MKSLVVEDDFTSSLLLQEILKHYGPCQTALDGQKAVEAVRTALDSGEPYDLITLDIMMPEMDGHEALKEIRALEEAKGIIPIKGVKVVMTTALDDSKNILASFKDQCDIYLTKPVDKARLLGELRKLKLIE
jgi:two-component system, chemotaxis family, chemotaxis protein CheY